jgi:prephenate dehydrogenase
VFGVDRPKVLDQARARDAIDDGGPASAGLQRIARGDFDAIVIALPVDATLDLLPRLADVVLELAPQDRPLILDVASVKAPVLSAAREAGCPRFVGGHPMAGLERGGIEHARPDLFEHATFALCPASERRRDLDDAKKLVTRLGARPLVVDAIAHDRAVALTSHAPHLLAWALMDAARELELELEPPHLPWALAGGSWADATRVAAADPRMWSSILGHNREAVAHALGRLTTRLEEVRRRLEAGEDPLSGDDPALPAAKLAALARRRASRER